MNQLFLIFGRFRFLWVLSFKPFKPHFIGGEHKLRIAKIVNRRISVVWGGDPRYCGARRCVFKLEMGGYLVSYCLSDSPISINLFMACAYNGVVPPGDRGVGCKVKKGGTFLGGGAP